ncbi:MAG: ABC transporter substrate-binding protein [Acetobacteraceae bacterium]|nr:ABC transporter substrate-binding protein [Acetobacteraceae bacterium]
MLARFAAITLAAALAATAAQADTLVVCTEGSPDFLNAALSTANTSFDVTEQTSDRLVGMEIGGSALVPSLAESWDVSEDGLTYTFKLRRGVKWQSNALFKPTHEFNADDVVFSFTRMSDKNSPYYGSAGAYPEFKVLIEPAFKSIRKIDDHTVAIELKQPYAPLLNVLSMQPFSISSAEYADVLQKAGKQEQLDTQPIGTGPFQFVQYQKDSVVRFRANPDFWGKAAGSPRAAKVDNLVFTITPDPSVRYAKLRANECQVARYPNPADLEAMRQNPQLKVQEAPIASISYISFRTDKKPLDDKRVREALSIAVDLDSLVRAVYQGSGTPTASMVPAALWGHDDSLKPRPYDPARAKQLLSEAGYPDGFETDLWAIPVVRAYMPNGRRAAEMIQADWAKIAVKAKIVTYEWGEYLRRTRSGEADIAMLGGTWDYPDPSQLLLAWGCDAKRAGRNTAMWCDQAFDTALTKANQITEQAKRAEYFKQAQRAFYDDMPGLLFADVKAFVAVRSNVQGFKLHFLGGQPFGGVSLGQ